MPTMRITPKVNVYGAAGALLTAGTTYTVDSAIGAELVGSGRAIDLDGVLNPGRTAQAFLNTDPLTGGSVGLSMGGQTNPLWYQSYDVVVYGANPGGLMAAIAAAREGAKVIVLERTDWIGGMTTGGISQTDVNATKCSATLVGLAKELYRRIAKYYGPNQRWQVYWSSGLGTEPKVAQVELKKMLMEAGVQVVTGTELVSVAKTGARITGALFTGISGVLGKCWIDATYEGDLIAMAGCSFNIGRESNATYGETDNGIAPLLSDSTQYSTSVDPYVTPGVPGSGLLPGISTETLGTTGAASAQVQAICYRINLTNDASIKIPFPEPTNYNPLNYELLGRHAAVAGGAWTTIQSIIGLFTFASIKFDVLHVAPMSIDYISPESTEYITATSERRKQIEANAKDWILGLLKFIQTDSRIPAAVRADVATYGFCKDEWVFNGGFPPVPYIRCGRRLVGDFVLNDTHIKAQNAFTDWVAYSYYGLDSHHVRCVLSGGQVKNEGKRMGASYVGAILPYRMLLPKVAECTNLMATFAVSASYAAHCSVRMEPISMALGHAAGIAAAWVSRTGSTVQNMDVAYLRDRQDIRGINKYDGSLLAVTTFVDGVVTETGTWSDQLPDANNFIPIGTKARQSTATGATIKFAPNVRQNGPHDVYLRWPDDQAVTRSTAVPVTVSHAGGTTTFTVNQNGQTGDGGDWFYAGQYVFAKGSPSTHFVQIGTDGGGGSTVINAIKVIPVHAYDPKSA